MLKQDWITTSNLSNYSTVSGEDLCAVSDSQSWVNQQTNQFREAISRRVLIFLSNYKLDQMRNHASYHPSEFQLEYYSNKRKIAFRMNLGPLTRFWNGFHHSPSVARIRSHCHLGFLLSIMGSSVISLDIDFLLHLWRSSWPIRMIPKEKRLNAIALLQKPLLTSKNECCRLDFLNVIKIGLSMIGKWWFLVMRLRSIDFSLMIMLGVGWGMENLHYKLIMGVTQSNMVVVQFLCGVEWLFRGMGYTCKIEGKMTQALYLSILHDGVM